VVIRSASGCVFEAIPWAEEGQRGSAARVAGGLLELVWSGFSRRLAREKAKVLLAGRLVGDVVMLTDGSSKRLLALDPSVPDEVVPFVFAAVNAGVYELRVTRSRAEAAALAASTAPAPSFVDGALRQGTGGG
jgi:hypothetical protein